MRSGGFVDAPDGWMGVRKTGLNDSDIAALVRAVRGGMDWDRAKRVYGAGVDPKVLEGWKPEILRKAGRSGPVLPEKPRGAAAAPAAPKLPRDVAEQLDIALAALVAARGDLAMRVLRELGAVAGRAPDGWIDTLLARAERPARAAAAPEPEPEALDEPLDEEPPAPRRPAPARRARRAAPKKRATKAKTPAAPLAEPTDGRTE
jgi:hypothetical protein